MSLGRERLTSLAGETGFRAETLEKVDRLIGLLDDVGRHPRLSRALALKGGTAWNRPASFATPRQVALYRYLMSQDPSLTKGHLCHSLPA